MKAKPALSLNDVRQLLVGENEAGISWARLAKEYSLPKSTIYAFAKRGYVPKDRPTLLRLGMPITVQMIVMRRDARGRFVR